MDRQSALSNHSAEDSSNRRPVKRAESVEELEAVIDGPISGEEGGSVISEVVVEEPVVNESVTEDTTSVPIEQVASDMGEVPFDGGKPIEGKPSDTMDYFEKLATA